MMVLKNLWTGFIQSMVQTSHDLPPQPELLRSHTLFPHKVVLWLPTRAHKERRGQKCVSGVNRLREKELRRRKFGNIEKRYVT